MAASTIRSTIYLDLAVHRALRLKAARTHRSISEIANDAIRAALREGEEDLAAFEARDAEESITYEELLARLRTDLGPSPRRGTPATELIEHFRHLPQVDPVQFRADVDSVLDASL